MVFIKRMLVLSIILGFALPLSADEVTKRRVEAAVRFLADDLLEGRGTPSRGLDIAALYLANELRAAGWQPGNADGYFQTYAVRTISPQKTRYRISINGRELDPQKFVFLPVGMDPSAAPLRYDLVFAGYGVFAPERGVDDYAGVDLRGKASVALRGARWDLDPAAVHAYDKVGGKSVHVAVRNGALLIYVSDELEAPVESPPSAEVALLRGSSRLPLAIVPEFKGKPTMGMSPVLAITPSEFDRTLASVAGGTYREWKERLAAQEPRARPLAASIEIKVETEPEEGQARNVVGILRGVDPDLRDEWVVLTAHYDHLGYRQVPAGQDGVYNGADDNASGTAAVLEIARQLASGKPPRRSVLVLFTSGEEMGLLGSAYYTLHPLVPNDRVVANINVDMVGRSTGAVAALATGCEEIFTKAAEIGKHTQVDVLPDSHPTWRLVYFVDSYHFARSSVPFVEFFTDFHSDYHQPTDEADRIRFGELGRITGAIFGLADYYTQGGKRPAFKRPAWFLTPD
jgi:hypothetical protein